ncbi:hypothetical protein [Streptomyces cucumeris]|uniref:hypothetical protein n=1 Tax=Streptomyces cucumeris TaxID=2962890 RepID=UPI003D70CDBD
MPLKRYTASTITDDALDTLYANASRGWRRGDRWKAEALEAKSALAEVLRIMSDWCVEANEVGGVDAGDLAFRLEQAGHPLPDDETAAPTKEAAGNGS